ncbi:hypothetical protein D3C73_1422370 [compost metagenome]
MLPPLILHILQRVMQRFAVINAGRFINLQAALQLLPFQLHLDACRILFLLKTDNHHANNGNGKHYEEGYQEIAHPQRAGKNTGFVYIPFNE